MSLFLDFQFLDGMTHSIIATAINLLRRLVVLIYRGYLSRSLRQAIRCSRGLIWLN